MGVSILRLFTGDGQMTVAWKMILELELEMKIEIERWKDGRMEGLNEKGVEIQELISLE
jgi:hypothetical protein